VSQKAAKAARKAAAVRAGKPTGGRSPAQRMNEARGRLRLGVFALLVVVAAGVGLYALTGHGGKGSNAASGSGGAYPYAVGSPSPGQQAAPVRLPATTGGTFDLAGHRGKEAVLLYFQEGLTCQPCWDQIAAIQKDRAKFSALGIGPIVSITTDRLDLITQKAKDDSLSIPVLADEDGRVSDAYDARSYGMMGHDRDGHTFVLVGKNGRILWRADYGGAPKYTMFVPDDVLLAQLKAGIKRQT
jgi:peroxiredoxin